MRVGREARVFPLLDMDGQTSRHLDPTREKLEKLGYASAVHRIDYEFQKGGHNMLRVTSR